MKKRVLLKKILLTLVVGAGLFLITSTVFAANIQPGLNEIASPLGLGTQDIRVTIANIIRVALGLLGIMAVVIIIIGGVMYLTSAGDPEKIKKAKELLIAAVIGLLIILTSFAIASFIINSILNAAGPGPGVNAVSCEITGTCPICEGPDCNSWGGCVDPAPDSSAPFICHLDPNHGPKGNGVTIQGGKFGKYLSGYSKVFFRQGTNDYEATVVLCNGQPSWDNNQIVVEVPNNLPFDETALNNFKVVVKIEGYASNEKSTGGGLTPNDQFTLTTGLPGPILACIVPNNGKENATVDVYGKRFGSIQSFSTLRFFENIFASVSSWSDELLMSSVPQGAKRGNVYVKVKDLDSNGYGFVVTCDNSSDCGSGCCFNGYFGKECADQNYCLPGVGQSCDTDNGLSNGCQAGICQNGLFCDANSNCTCQPAGPGTPCDADNNSQNGCQADNNKCGNGLYCSSLGACTCQYLPRIDDVQPRNGAPGNFITLFGRGFGSVKNVNTSVIFLGDLNNPNDDKTAIFPGNCSASQLWQDNQVIVAIPDGAKNGPLKLINSDGLSDTTADDNGWKGDFEINDIIRPGLCGASPDSGSFSTSVDLSGNNFGTVGQSLIGGIEFNKGSKWSWANQSISDVTVPNLAPAENLPVQVKVGTENSNPINFTVTVPALMPKIDYVDPIKGPTDQYVTIFGSNFGIENGTVFFDNGESAQDKWAIANTIFPEACKLAGYWHNTYIVVKVPSDTSIGASHIVVKTNDKYGGFFSNSVDFTHNNAKAGPGICAISPDQGPIGLPGVTLYGEKFDAYGAQSKVNFWDSKLVPDAASAWSDKQIGSGTLHVPPMTVPTGSVTGPVKLYDQAGNGSNKILFTVGDCRQNKALCTEANPCCDPRDGVCKSTAECQIVYPAMCTYGWSFTTGKMPPTLPPPQVIEDKSCITNTQSPEPWKKSVDNCANIWIKARFNQDMNVDSFQNNITVQACGTADTLADNAVCTSISGSVVSFQKTGIIFKPVKDLVPNTWYRVTLNGHTGGIKSAQGVLLDGNFDNIAGGDYTWYYRVRNSDKACDVDKVVVVPQEATLTKLTDTQFYDAFAMAANCNDLNEDAYNWHWYKKYSDRHIEEAGSLDPGYSVAMLTNNDNNHDGNIDYEQLAMPRKQGLTFVGAEVFPGDPLKNRKDDDNKLVVDLNLPEITDFYPKDGLVRPEVNTYVTIYGKHFGKTQGSSQVLFDDVPAPLANCANAWSDEIIRVKVPQGQLTTPGTETTYQLPSTLEKKEGMVVYYNFEETNSALVEDKANKNDAEIKGQPQRVSDQLGQAMAFNGTSDYLKLPNNLDINTGSLEVWFKPEANGTLFSASDGTATNLFALDYTSVANGVIKSGQWNYLVYTYDGTTPLIYLNGFKFTVFDKGITKTGTDNFINSNKNNILIGAKNTGTLADYFKGRIDNFALYNKVLTAEEVRANYGLKEGQVLFLKFDEDGSQIFDSSANKFANISIKNPAINFRTSAGKVDKAVEFKNDNFITVNADPSLNFNKAITIKGWFKPISSTFATPIFKANNIALGILSECGGDFCFRAFITDPANPGAAGFKYKAISRDKIKVNDWNYFAGVYDGQKIKVYLNGEQGEYDASGEIYQSADFGTAWLGGNSNGFNGALDEIAVYNRALSDGEISSQLGAKDNSFLNVVTSGGSTSTDFNSDKIKDPGETFKFSDNLYPFLCQLEPDFGLAGTSIKIEADNLGDSNKTTFQNKIYGVGSYVHFTSFIPDILSDRNIKSWANKLLNINNPYSEVNILSPEGDPVIPILASIDPYSEPYNDVSGSYVPGDEFADTTPAPNGNGIYDKTNYKVGSEVLPNLKSNWLPFGLPPIITSITPDNGPIKQWVTIRGHNFGKNRGKVYFYNNQEASTPPEPCENTWTNTQIIAVVPDGATSGEVYVETAKGLQSNKVNFTVNNNPLGAGLCDLFTIDDYGYSKGANGKAGEIAYALGDRFEENQGQSQLVFNINQNSAINNWANNYIDGSVPVDAVSGDVVVTKKMETGRVCAGFHIGSWCPAGDINTGAGYDIIYQNVPSNPLYFNVSKLACGKDQGGLGTDGSLVAGYPLKPFDNTGPSNKANTALIATDGQYLYTKSWDAYTYSSPDKIYKIGTGYGNTKSGEIVKVYSLAAASPYSAPQYSITYHSDGNFYAGADYTTGTGNATSAKIAHLIFNDSDNTYQVKLAASIPENLYDIYGNEANHTNDALITSNGNYIFNVATEFGGVDNQINKIKVKIFNPANNWQVVKKFEITTDNLSTKPAGGAGIVADNNYIYLFPSNTGDVLVIDWQKEGIFDQWGRDHINGSPYEINGQFDWQHRVFWLGDLQYLPNGYYNYIYKYNACALAGACQKDEDCVACGTNTSKCLNGMCQPYIKDFTPVSGSIGTYVSLTGCYFGCNLGTIYFTGQNKVTSALPPGNAEAYFPLVSDIKDYAKNYSVNLYSCNRAGTTCTAANPSDYLAGGLVLYGGKNDKYDFVKATNVQIQPSFTALAWAKSDTNTWNNDGWITSSRDANGFIIHPNIGQKTWDGYVVNNSTNNYMLIKRENINDITQWHQYGVMYDAVAKKAYMVFDGQFVADGKTMDSSRVSNKINISIGSDSYPHLYRFGKGMVSEVRLYNRTLSIDEIKNLYDIGNTYEKSWVMAVVPECKVTWLCSADSKSDEVLTEAPNKKTETADDDAITGPLKLVTAGGLANTTEALSPSDFTVNSIAGQNICSLDGGGGLCGNGRIDTGEQCDGNTMPSPLPACPADKPNCTFKCSATCGLLVCDANGQNCVPYTLCGNGTVDSGEDCDGTNLNGQSCQSKGLGSGTLSCSAECTFNTSGCIGAPPEKPKVVATVPRQAEENFCRNGIVDIYFNSAMDTDTLEKIEKDTLTRNIIIESCTSGTLTPPKTTKSEGIINRSIAFIKNIFSKLFAYKTPILAQLSACTAFDNNDFYLRAGLINEKTAVQLIPINLLEPDHFYRVTIIGGDIGIKSQKGANLDNSNSPVIDSTDYIFEFKTMGTATDAKSGICNVEWIDTRVYRQPYSSTDLASRNAEYRSDDLFTCAGKDDCTLDTDFDQDAITTGNQHIYQAIAKYRGEFSLKASYQWSKNDNTDPDKAIEIYNQTDVCIAGDPLMYNKPCNANADCGIAGGICDQGDTSTDLYKVKNGNGITYTTAKPVKVATANLVIEAQAQGSLATPVQQTFTVYLLLCENPWPSLNEKFPISNLINAYNFQTYYCRDAGPPGPEGDLPAARILVSNIANLNNLGNTDFEYGNLSGWVDLAGTIFKDQPVKSKIAAEGWIINTAYRQLGDLAVDDAATATGVLQSQAFVIEGDQLNFKIGGLNDPSLTRVVFATKSDPLTDFADQQSEDAGNGDLMTKKTFDLRPYTLGRACKTDSECNGFGTCDTENSQCTPILGIIRIEDNSQGGHIDFDDLKQFKAGTQIPLRY